MLSIFEEIKTIKQIKKINYSLKQAFTIAEVLITLTVIGIVSAMTIPTLLQGQQEKAAVTALKKTYSTLSNAYKLAEQENGTPDTWGMTTAPANSKPILEMLKPYLNVAKDCTDNSQGCWPTGLTYRLLATSYGTGVLYDTAANPKLKLADGTLIYGFVEYPACNGPYGNSLPLQNGCGVYHVDINGYKQPNQWGKDVFAFYLTKYGVVPFGSEQDTAVRFSSHCKDQGTQSGWGCAAWVIYNENLDYLHCKTIDWNSATKCP